MAERTDDQPTPQPQEPTVSGTAKPADVSAEAAPVAAVTVATLPQPELAPAAVPDPIAATVKSSDVEASDLKSPDLETPKLASPALDAPTLDSTIAVPMTPPADVRPSDIRTDDTIAAADTPSLLSAWTTSPSVARARRLAPLAATIAIAAALGAMAGSFATGRVGASEAVPQSADARGITQQVARLHAELAALKTSIDGSAKSASAQLIRLGDRLDRVEKAQAEPTAKLAKLADAVDRIERRTPTTVAAAAHDITGTITALAPAPQLEAPETRPASPPVLEGWRVRSVYNGAALIQARAGGLMEIEPGDNLPGLGRIEAIRRQEGKWVVVTSKGVILAR